MKNIVLLGLVFLGIFATIPAASAADKPASDGKIINLEIAPPTVSTNLIIEVSVDDVQYAVRSGDLWSLFVADHQGNLERFHIVVVDTIIFSWDTKKGVETSGVEKVDLKKWQDFFKQKLALKPFTLKLDRR